MVTMRKTLERAALVVGVLVLGIAAAHAQPSRPTAVVTALAERDGVRPGDTIRLAVRVVLPEGLHVQANEPRDPSLIPTVLTLDAPAGVEVIETIYPRPTDLAQSAQPTPLAVYGHDFLVGMRVKVDRATASGALSLAARLRYQACDERTCYTPATARFTWSLRVVVAPDPIADKDSRIINDIGFTRGNH